MAVERGAVGAGIGGEEPRWGTHERGGEADVARDAGEKHGLRIARSVWWLSGVLFALLVEVDDGLNLGNAVVRD